MGAREVIVLSVLVAFGILLIFPYILGQREEERRHKCELRQVELALAIQSYADLQRRYPYYADSQFGSDHRPAAMVGWTFAVLPHWKQITPDSTHLAADIFERYGATGPEATRGQSPVEVYFSDLMCPNDLRITQRPARAWTSFVSNCGMPDVAATEQGPADWPANGVMVEGPIAASYGVVANTPKTIEEADGLEYTLLLAENADAGLWTDRDEASIGFLWVAGFRDGTPDPGDALLRINQGMRARGPSTRSARPSSWHAGGVNVVLASGRSQFISQNIDYIVYANLMTSNAKEVRKPGSDQLLPPPYRLESSSD